MKEEIKYYTPETQEEVINWIMSEGYLLIKGEAETEGMSNFKLSFGEDFKDNLYYLVEFINSQNKTEFNNKTVEQSTALELFEIPYLNQQDIEECEFKFKEFNKYLNADVFVKNTELGINQFEVCQITLFKDYPIQILLEYNTHTGYEEQSIYKYLKVKNKSKLKEVLQMIGVL
jgi:hypothetical protein